MPGMPGVLKTKRGLGVHRASKHPEAVNAEVELPSVKRRWREEEKRLLAYEEAKATIQGVLFMNQHLLELVPDRTLEAIKGVRRPAKYKAMVAAMVNDIRTGSGRASFETSGALPATSPTPPSPVASPVTTSSCPPEDEGRCSLAYTIRSQADLLQKAGERHYNGPALVTIAEETLLGHDVHPAIMSWLQNTLPEAIRQPPGRHPPHRYRSSNTRAARRRREYALTQNLWRKNRKRAANLVIDGGRTEVVHTLDEFESFWTPIFSARGPTEHLREPARLHPELAGIWGPVSLEEIEETAIPLNTASGPDGITSRAWRAIPALMKALLYNIALYSGGLPADLAITRTVFIPKTSAPLTPADYRPISVGPVVARHFHKILSSRLQKMSLMDVRQRGFIDADGTAENTAVLDVLLRSSRQHLRELHVAVLDVSKAFDSLSHESLVARIHELGFPAVFEEYIGRLYRQSSTILEVRKQRSQPIPVRQGVRQGDPLSPLLFNLAINKILDAIPPHIGYQLGPERVSALAFADDLVLVSESKWGMQLALRHVEAAAAKQGLRFNPRKSSTLSIVPAGKEKKFKFLTEPQYKIAGALLPATKILDRWRYLGVDYQAKGASSVEEDLAAVLQNISKAPLKPQQRLTILSTYLLPRLYYSTVLGRVTAGRLQQLDRQVRAAVRTWLRLPHDVALGYFHAAIKDGGLGIPSLSLLIPALTAKRIRRLADSASPAARVAFDSQWVQAKLRWARQQLRRFGVDPDRPTRDSRRRYWATVLHKSVDGYELRESSGSNLSTNWVARNSQAIPGRDYVQYHHVRINCLPTRIRVSRGQRRQHRKTRCRAGCNATETAAHVIQRCWRTHGGRVERHNTVAKSLATGLREKGWTVVEEPHIRTKEGIRKPDIVAGRGEQAVIVDAQVVSAANPLKVAHQNKAAKYGKDEEVVSHVAALFKTPTEAVASTSCTVSWRGVWSHNSHEDLKALGLTDSLLQGLTTRILQGSSTNWTRFNQLTGSRPAQRVEEGVG